MSLPDRTDPDPDPEPGPGAGGVRLCGYRHCRAPLPVVAGRGNRARYCQDGKTWGAQELSCKAAEAAYLAVESLQPEDPALTPAAVDALGERLDAAVEPLREVLDAVLAARGQDETQTRAALAARDAALAEAADPAARGRPPRTAPPWPRTRPGPPPPVPWRRWSGPRPPNAPATRPNRTPRPPPASSYTRTAGPPR